MNTHLASKTIELIAEEYGNNMLNPNLVKSILKIAKNDKKNTHQQINFCLLSAIGQCDINIALSEAEILSTLSK